MTDKRQMLLRWSCSRCRRKGQIRLPRDIDAWGGMPGRAERTSAINPHAVPATEILCAWEFGRISR
jgi:hypothetical protein